MGKQNLKIYISEYYKKLFGASTPNNLSLMEDLNQYIPHVSEDENILLIPRSKKCTKLFLRWNIIKHQSQTAFRLSSIKSFGKLLRRIDGYVYPIPTR